MNAISKQIQDQVDLCRHWPARLPPERWTLYRDVMAATIERGVSFAVGGGMAAMAYAGQWRDTKDVDLYICPEHRDVLVQILQGAGLADYYEQLPYDRRWIYRSHRDDTIIDIIWAMANQRTQVDERWLQGPKVMIDGLEIRLLPPEEAVWSKLYIVQRDRCDWPDAMNMLYMVGEHLDWKRLLVRLEDDTELLGALLAAFRWLCPAHAARLPEWLWARVGLTSSGPNAAGCDERRANFLDTRPWFTPVLHDEARLLRG